MSFTCSADNFYCLLFRLSSSSKVNSPRSTTTQRLEDSRQTPSAHRAVRHGRMVSVWRLSPHLDVCCTPNTAHLFITHTPLFRMNFQVRLWVRCSESGDPGWCSDQTSSSLIIHWFLIDFWKSAVSSASVCVDSLEKNSLYLAQVLESSTHHEVTSFF